jgi:predicted small secreted protein
MKVPEKDSLRKSRSVLALAALIATMALAQAACNATEGFGKDLEETGDNISDASRDARD